ncbi:MAG: hypothetical protein U9Q06_03215 [Nanoarchaeota archaeon]|nr:hypothetical protein [Nanoarchaeota archaeon]
MKSKGGFLRILEAFFAVLIIAGALGFLYVENVHQPKQDERIYQLMRLALKEIENDDLLRTEVLDVNLDPPDDLSAVFDKHSNGNVGKIVIKLSAIIPEDYDYKFRICKLDSACGVGEGNLPDKNVLSLETSVSSTLISNPDSRKIRIFVWEK